MLPFLVSIGEFMNKIQTVEATGLYEWEVSTQIEGKEDALDFTLFGATFEDGSTTKTIDPNASAVFTFKLKANAPQSDMVVHHAVVQYDDYGLPVTLQEACRNIVRPVSTIIDFRLQTQGFEALPRSVVPSSGINMILGQVDELTEFDPDLYTELEKLPTGALTFDQAITIYYDRFRKIRYWLADIHTDAPLVVKKDSIDLVDTLMRYHPTTKMRQIIDVLKNGQLHVYGIGATYTTVDLKCKIVRARFAGAALRIIDDRGVLRVFDGLTFEQAKVYDNDFFTDISGANFAITRSGKIDPLNTDPSKVKIANDSGLFFYYADPNSNKFYGYDPSAKTTIQVFDWDAQTLTPRQAMTPERILAYKTLASVSNNGAVMTEGTEYVPESEQIFIGVTSNPYEGVVEDRRFGYFLNDVPDLKHITTPEYGSVIPAFNVELGDVVKAKFTVDVVDKDMALPITLPDTVTWTAKVNGVESKTVRSGDVLELEMRSPELTYGYFPISIGRSSGLIEIVPDSMPDPFTFKSVHEQPENFWYSTEEITITGINVRVPLTLTVNEGVDYTRFRIYVNGVEKQMPVYIYNNDKLRLDVYHETFQTRVGVTIGDRTSNFGVYTIDELPIPPLTNWCYVPAGKRIVSDPILNDSPADLDLTITTNNATFANGQTTIKLGPGKTTNIIHVAAPNTKATIGYKSVVYSYEWKVWSDNVWLDAEPTQKRSDSMNFSESDPIKFTSIPVTAESKWKTILRVPSGILLTVGADLIDADLDSRSVYINPFELEIDVQDLEIGAYPRTSPYLIGLGDAVLAWSFLYTTDPTYEQGTINVQTFTQRFKATIAEKVTTVKSNLIAAYRHLVTSFDQSARTAQILAHTISQEFESVEVKSHTISNLFKDVKTSVKYFDQSAETQLIEVQTFNQKMKKIYVTAPKYFDMGDARYLTERDLGFEYGSFAYTRWEQYLADMLGQSYVTQTINKSAQQLVADYLTDNIWKSDAQLTAKFTKDVWYYIARDLQWRYKDYDHRWIGMNAKQMHLFYAYKVAMSLRWVSDLTINYVLRIPRWITGTAQADRNVQLYAQVVSAIDRIKVEQRPANIRSYVYRWINPDYSPRYFTQSVNRLLDSFKPNHISDYHTWVGREYDPRMIVDRHTWVEREDKARYVQTSTTSGDQLKLDPNYVVKYVTHIAQDKVPRPVEQNPEMVIAARKKSATAKVILPMPMRKFHAPMDELSEGKTDPLENGYFATEQLALRNAVTVWGHDPSVVKAAQRPDGTWYWIREIPCDNSCGAYSCDSAGYMSGG